MGNFSPQGNRKTIEDLGVWVEPVVRMSQTTPHYFIKNIPGIQRAFCLTLTQHIWTNHLSSPKGAEKTGFPCLEGVCVAQPLCCVQI